MSGSPSADLKRNPTEANEASFKPARFHRIRVATHLCVLRVRAQPVQELLAVLGIASGVALLFAVQVASTSLTGSVRQIANAVTGDASIEMVARNSRGIEQAMVRKVDQLPSVRSAAPVVQQQVVLAGPRGRAALTLVGVDQRLEENGGELVRRFGERRRDLDSLGLFITTSTAKSLSVVRGDRVAVESGGVRRALMVAGVLGTADIGKLAKSPLALAPLGMVQRVAGEQGRVSRIFVAPFRGQEADAAAAVRGLAGDRFDVRSSDTEVALLAKALSVENRLGLIFSLIAVVIGMLFAYNAILLSMDFRRRFIGSLRLIGTDRSMIITTLVIETIALGLAAAAVGLIAGDVLSRVVFDSFPRYLASGFPIGDQRVIEGRTIAFSVIGGIAAAAAAFAAPAIELFKQNSGAALGANDPDAGGPKPFESTKTIWAGLAVVVVSGAVVFLIPALSLLLVVSIAVGMAIVIRPAVGTLLALTHRYTKARGGAGPAVAVGELIAAPGRALALALIAAGAAFAMLSLGGARLDVERGTVELNNKIFAGADLWVLPPGGENAFMSKRFEQQPLERRLAALPAVKSVGDLHGMFADVDGRRVLIAAHAADAPDRIASKLVTGDPAQAAARIESGGWIALYDPMARERKLKIGDWLALRTAAGSKRYRLAATVDNYGWPSGVVVMNNRDFVAAWGDGQASALAIQLDRGFSADLAESQIRNALGTDSALSVRSPGAAVDDRVAVVAQGMARLRQLSALVLVVSVLAIVAAMFAVVWQRRIRIASLRAIGMYRSEIFRSLLAETTLIVLVGAAIGAAFGLFAQFFASRWIEYSSGFHAPYEPAFVFAVVTLAQLVALAVVATVGPAMFAARAAPSVDDSV